MLRSSLLHLVEDPCSRMLTQPMLHAWANLDPVPGSSASFAELLFTLGSDKCFLPTSPSFGLMPGSRFRFVVSACTCNVIILPSLGDIPLATSAAATTPTGTAPSTPFATTCVVSSGITTEDSVIRRFIILTLRNMRKPFAHVS